MGHTNPTPKCTLHTCAQIEACEVDSASVQSSIQHLYTFDAPNWRQRGCTLVGRASTEAGEIASDACFISSTAGSDALGTAPLDSWGGGWEIRGGWSVANFPRRGGAEDVEGCNIAPLRSLRDLPPLNLPLLLQSSPTLPFLCTEPPSSNWWASSFKELTLFNKSSP